MSYGTYDALAELRASSLQPVGSENGDGKDLGPIKLTRAVLIATVVESGGSLSTAKIQGSSDNSTFYDIPGSNFLDPDDGAAIAAVGAYEVYIKSQYRYYRCVTTVAGDDITHQIILTAV